MSFVKKKVIKIIKEVLTNDESLSFGELDSITFLDLMLTVEKEFALVLLQREVLFLHKVQDLVYLIENKLENNKV